MPILIVYGENTGCYMVRRTVEAWILWFRVDLKLSNILGSIHDKLSNELVNGELFDDEIADYFANEQTPYTISGTEPSQVQLLKDLLNKLADAQKTFDIVEQLDLNHNRSQVGIFKDAALEVQGAINKLYPLVELLNQSPAHLQHITNPIQAELMPKISQALAAIQDQQAAQEAPFNSVEQAGQSIAQAINHLPDNPSGHQAVISEAFAIPKYLLAMEQSLDNSAQSSHIMGELFSITNYFSKVKAELQQPNTMDIDSKKLSEQAKKAQYHIEKLIKTNKYLPSNLFTNSPHYLGIGLSIAAISSDLLSTSQPITREAYLRSVALLDKLRHQELPKLLAELDFIELELGLKAGTLSNPVLESMDDYYQTMAGYVNRLPQYEQYISTATQYANTWYGKAIRWLAGDSSNSIPEAEALQALSPNLSILQDHTFLEARQSILAQRKVAPTKTLTILKQKKEAAAKFFEKIDSLWNLLELGSVKHLPIEMRLELSQEYKQFQPHLANKHPRTDKVLVNTLNVTPIERLKLIAKCSLSQQQKEILANALQESLPLALECIKGFKLSEVEQKHLSLAISSPECQEQTFSQALIELKDPTESRGFFGTLIDYADIGLGTAVYATLLTATAVMPHIDEIEEVKQCKHAVFHEIETEISDQKLKLSLIDKQQQNIEQQKLTSTNKLKSHLETFDELKALKEALNKTKAHQTPQVQPYSLYHIKLQTTHKLSAIATSESLSQKQAALMTLFDHHIKDIKVRNQLKQQLVAIIQQMPQVSSSKISQIITACKDQDLTNGLTPLLTQSDQDFTTIDAISTKLSELNIEAAEHNKLSKALEAYKEQFLNKELVLVLKQQSQNFNKLKNLQMRKLAQMDDGKIKILNQQIDECTTEIVHYQVNIKIIETRNKTLKLEKQLINTQQRLQTATDNKEVLKLQQSIAQLKNKLSDSYTVLQQATELYQYYMQHQKPSIDTAVVERLQLSIKKAEVELDIIELKEQIALYKQQLKDCDNPIEQDNLKQKIHLFSSKLSPIEKVTQKISSYKANLAVLTSQLSSTKASQQEDIKQQIMLVNKKLADAYDELKAIALAEQVLDLETYLGVNEQTFEEQQSLQQQIADAINFIPLSQKVFEPLQDTSTLTEISPNELQHQIVLFELEKQKLKDYQADFNEFYQNLESFNKKSLVPEKIKENRAKLITSLRKFQPFLAYLDPQNSIFEKKFIAFLQEDSVISIDDLQADKAHILQVLQTQIARNTQITTQLKMHYSFARKMELIETPLIEQPSIAQATLFNSVSELELDKKILQLRTETFPKYLKEHLSETLFNSLDIENLTFPIIAYHKDTETEALYKRTLNALYHLEEGLKAISDLNTQGNPESSYARSQYLRTVVMDLTINLYSSYYYLAEAKEQPHLQKLIYDSLEILKPLQETPLADVLSQAQQSAKLKKDPVVPPTDALIDVWNEQMQVITQELNAPLPEKLTPSKKVIVENSGQEQEQEEEEKITLTQSATQQLATKLYQLENSIKRHSNLQTQLLTEQQVNQKTQKLLKKVNALSKYNFWDKAYIANVAKVIDNVTAVASLGKEAIYQRLQDLPDKVLTEMLKVSDNTEANLGLKPGNLSSEVLSNFEDFYVALISQLDLDDDITTLSYLECNVNIIDKRIEYLQQQRQNIDLNGVAQKDIQNIFGTEQYYTSLKGVVNQIKQLKQEIIKEEEELDVDIYTVDFSHLNQLNAQLQASQNAEQVLYQMATEQKNNSPYQTIAALQDADFSDTPDGRNNRTALIESYSKLQPYLFKIHYSYDRKYVLRELQTAQDFKALTKRIVDNAVDLSDIIQGAYRHQTQLKLLYNQQIADLQAQKQVQNQDITQLKKQRFDKLKTHILLNHVEQVIKPKFDMQTFPIKPLGEFASVFTKETYQAFKENTKLSDIKEPSIDDAINLEEQIIARAQQTKTQLSEELNPLYANLLKLHQFEIELQTLNDLLVNIEQNPFQLKNKMLIETLLAQLENLKVPDEYSQTKAQNLTLKILQSKNKIEQRNYFASVYDYLEQQKEVVENKADKDYIAHLQTIIDTDLQATPDNIALYQQFFINQSIKQAISEVEIENLTIFTPLLHNFIFQTVTKTADPFLNGLAKEKGQEPIIAKFIDAQISQSIDTLSPQIKKLQQLEDLTKKIKTMKAYTPNKATDPIAYQKQQFLIQQENELLAFASLTNIDQQQLDQKLNQAAQINKTIEAYDLAIKFWQYANQVQLRIQQEAVGNEDASYIQDKQHKVQEVKDKLAQIAKSASPPNLTELKQHIESASLHLEDSAEILTKYSSNNFTNALFKFITWLSNKFAKVFDKGEQNLAVRSEVTNLFEKSHSFFKPQTTESQETTQAPSAIVNDVKPDRS